MNEFYNPMECAWGTRCYLFPIIFFLIFQGGGETTPLEQLNMCFVPTLISHFCHFHCFYLKKSSELAVAGAWKIKANGPTALHAAVRQDLCILLSFKQSNTNCRVSRHNKMVIFRFYNLASPEMRGNSK